MNAEKYMRWYSNYFWRPALRDPVIETARGGTIIYWDYLNGILQLMLHGGFPRVTPLLLCIYALRSDDDLDRTWSELGSRFPDLQEAMSDSREFLKTLRELPGYLKEEKFFRDLIVFLFRDSHHRLKIEHSKLIAKEISFDACNEVSGLPSRDASEMDLRVLALLHKKYPNSQVLISEFGQTPEKFLEQLWHNQGDFFEYWNNVEELGAASGLMKPYMKLSELLKSALAFPSKIPRDPSRAVAGFSDISNRGEVHQLLLSEFAYEDEVFLQRLATSEALYIEKDRSRSGELPQRVYLIDVTLANWGTPKMIAFSLVLAANLDKQLPDFAVFTIGDAALPAPMGSAKLLIEAQRHNSSRLECSVGLEQFFEESWIEKDVEYWFITHARNAGQADLSRVFSQNQIQHVIYTDESGHISWYRNSKAGMQLWQEVKLPMHQMYPKPKISRKTALVDLSALRVCPPYKRHLDCLGPWQEYYFLSHQLELLRFSNPEENPWKQAFDLVCQKLPVRPQVFAVGCNSGRRLIAYVKENADRHYFLDLQNLDIEDIKPGPWLRFIHAAYFYKDYFLLKGGPNYYKIDLNGDAFRTSISTFELNYMRFQDERKKKVQSRHRYNKGYLKNLKSVSIDVDGNLCFGRHCFKYHAVSDGFIRIDAAAAGRSAIRAEKQSDNIFEFPNGLKVFGVSGCIYLEHPSFDRIEISSIMDQSCALIRGDFITGNSRYWPRSLDLFQFNPQDILSKQELQKLLEGKFGLRKEVLENFRDSQLPCHFKVVSGNTNEFRAMLDHYQIEFESWNMKAAKDYEELSASDFYERFIEPLIQDVLHFEA